jgi:hypothetical protein
MDTLYLQASQMDIPTTVARQSRQEQLNLNQPNYL